MIACRSSSIWWELPAEDVARLGKDVRGRSQVTDHGRKAVKLTLAFRVCMQASDVYGRTDKVDVKSCRPLFGAGSVEAGGERSTGDRISLSDFRSWAATKFFVVGA